MERTSKGLNEQRGALERFGARGYYVPITASLRLTYRRIGSLMEATVTCGIPCREVVRS